MVCVKLSDELCLQVLPRVQQLNHWASFWEQRRNHPWYVALEATGTSVSYSQRLHDISVHQHDAMEAANCLAEAVGHLHFRLGDIGNARSESALRQAVREYAFLANAYATWNGTQEGWKHLRRTIRKGQETQYAELGDKKCLMMLRDLSDGLPVLKAKLQNLAQEHRKPNPFVLRLPDLVLIGVPTAIFVSRSNPVELAKTGNSLFQQGKEAISTMVTENIVIPITEIANTLLKKDVSIVQWDKVSKQSQDTLNEMAAKFLKDLGKPHGTRSDMQTVMKVYEEEVRKPLLGAVSGKLLRAALIQVQEVKTNLELELASVDKLIQMNQLNLQIMATVPAMLVFGLAVTTAHRLVKFLLSEPQHPRRQLASMVHEMHRSLIEEQASNSTREVFRKKGIRCMLVWEASDLLSAHRIPGVPYESHATLLNDISCLASPRLPVEQKLALLDVIYRQFPEGRAFFSITN